MTVVDDGTIADRRGSLTIDDEGLRLPPAALTDALAATFEAATAAGAPLVRKKGNVMEGCPFFEARGDVAEVAETRG